MAHPRAFLAAALAALLPAAAFAEPDSLGAAERSLAPALARVRASRPPRRAPRPMDDYAELVLYHTNDIHGHIAPTPANAKTGAPASGGAASLATMLEKESRPHLWIDSGDWYQGTPEGTLTHGRALVDVFNRLGLAAAALGNHDYDHGEENLRALVAGAHFTVLAANVRSAATGDAVDYAQPYMLLTVDGIKVGVVGLLTSGMTDLSAEKNIQGLAFESEIEAARRSVRELKAKGAQLIVAATHMGIDEYRGRVYDGPGERDIALARAVPDINLILGGHTHTAILKPLYVQHPDGRLTLITQTGGMLSSVYRIVLHMSRSGDVIGVAEASLVPVDPAVYPPDPAVARLVGSYEALAAKEMSRPIGAASAAFDKAGPGETAIGGWVADVIRAYAGAEIGVMNSGGVRAGLPAGPLVYRDVYEVDPFDDLVLRFQVTGAELKRAVELSIGASDLSLQFSGLEAEYDPKAPAGARLLSLKVGGVPVDDARVYTAAAPEFVAMVDKPFKSVRKAPGERLPVPVHDLLAQAVEKGSPVAPPPAGRFRAR